MFSGLNPNPKNKATFIRTKIETGVGKVSQKELDWLENYESGGKKTKDKDKNILNTLYPSSGGK